MGAHQLLGAAWLLLLLLAALASPASSQRRLYSQHALPETGFTCADKAPGGYYADAEADCQMFHVCVQGTFIELQDFRFLCPNGTAFDQEHLVCAAWNDVACGVHGIPFFSAFELLKIGVAERELGTPAPTQQSPVTPPAPVLTPAPRTRFRQQQYEGDSNSIRGGEAVEESLHYRPLEPSPRQSFRPFPTTRQTTTTTTTTTVPPEPYVQPLRQAPRGRNAVTVQPRPSSRASSFYFSQTASSPSSFYTPDDYYTTTEVPTTPPAPQPQPSSHRFGSRRRVLVRRPRPTTTLPPVTTTAVTTYRPTITTYRPTITTYRPTTTYRPATTYRTTTYRPTITTTYPTTTTTTTTTRRPQRRRTTTTTTTTPAPRTVEALATTYRPPLPLVLLGFTASSTQRYTTSTPVYDTSTVPPTRSPEYDYSYYESDNLGSYNDASDDHFFLKSNAAA